MYGAASASDAILIEVCSTDEPKVRTEEVKGDDFYIHSSIVDLGIATAGVGRGSGGRDGSRGRDSNRGRDGIGCRDGDRGGGRGRLLLRNTLGWTCSLQGLMDLNNNVKR